MKPTLVFLGLGRRSGEFIPARIRFREFVRISGPSRFLVGILAKISGIVNYRDVKDIQFYQRVLGLRAPWRVAKVDLDMEAKRVAVRVELKEGTRWVDPKTKTAAHVHEWTERKWRHLDTCQFETVIVAKVPSVRYADGRVEEVKVPWAERYQRVTKMMAQAVIVWLEACGNVRKVAEIMRLDWHTVDAIMKAAVERGLKFLKEWITKVNRSRLEPMKKVARMLAGRIQGVLNYIKHRITNAASEGMNSQVARVIANARGLRTFKTLRIRVLFFLGKLDLSIA